MANTRTSIDKASLTSQALAKILPSVAMLDALQLILAGAALSEILTSLTRLIESYSEGMLCSIFLVDPDRQHLHYAAAPNLPESYKSATDGAAVGPNSGPCSLAVHNRQVVVANFLSDPTWSNFRDKPLAAGLLAAWSSPILSHEGGALGTFGMYFREVRTPGPAEVELIDYASRIAGIAIERERSQVALNAAFEETKKSEGQLRQMVDAIPQTVVVLGPDGSVVYVNRTVLDYTGLSPDELMGTDFRE